LSSAHRLAGWIGLALGLGLTAACAPPASAARYAVWYLADGRAPTVSADGRQVWFWSRAGAQWQLYRCGVDGSGMVALTGPGAEWPDMPGQTKATVRAVSASASGSALVAVGRYVLHLGSPPSDLAVCLTGPPSDLIDALVTRDGTRLVSLATSVNAAADSGARLTVGSPAGPAGVTVWEGSLAATGPVAPRLAASADGEVIALVVRGPADGPGEPGVGRVAIWLRREDGTWEQDDAGLPPAYGLPCLSADGQRLAYVSGLDDTRVLTFDRARGTVCSIATGAGETIASLAMDDFGRRVAICAGGRVYYASFTGHTSHEVAGLSGARSVSLSADGDVLAAETNLGIMLGTAGGNQAPPAGRAPALLPAPTTARGRQIRTFDETLADLYRLAQRIRQGPGGASGEPEAAVAPRPSGTGVVATDPETGWQLYEHAGLGLRVLVPPGWQALEDTVDEGVVLMGTVGEAAPDAAGATASGQAGIRVTLAPAGEDDLMLVAQEAMSVAEMEQPPSRSSGLLSGATAVRLEGDGIVDGARQRVTTLAAAIGGRTYCVAALTPDSAGPRTREWIRRALQSLTVMP